MATQPNGENHGKKTLRADSRKWSEPLEYKERTARERGCMAEKPGANKGFINPGRRYRQEAVRASSPKVLTFFGI